MAKIQGIGMFVVVLAMTFFFISVTSSGLAGEQFVLKAVHQNPPTHPYQIGLEKFKEDVEKKTDGRVKIDIFHSGQLGNERELIEQLMFGSVDFIVCASAPWANFVPDMMTFDLPFIFRDRSHAYAVLDGPIGEKIGKSIESEGLLFLGYWENGFRHISNSRVTVNTPADMKGLKIRLMENPIHLATFRALGALPTPMAWPEVFTALQQKTIDGMENSPVIYITANMYEVQKYISLTGHFYSPSIFTANAMKFNSLPADVQKVILECAIDARDFERKYHEESDDEYLQQMKDKGMIITEVDKQPFMDAVKPLYAEYGKKLNVEDVLKQIMDAK